jgi:hypothetical protein
VDNIPTVLKAFVIGGGIMLVAGTVLLVALLVLRAVDDPPASPPQDGPLLLQMPAGVRVEQVVPSGRRLILLGVDRAGRQFVAVVDPLTGERISLLQIRPEE